MTDIYHFSEIELLGFVLVFLRLSAFFVSWPIFGSTSVPPHVKILISLVVTFIVFPLVGWKKLQVGIVDSEIITLSIREVLIGVIIGFSARFIFFSLAMAGQLISISMGLSTAQLFNPSLNIEGSAMETLKVMLGSVFFLVINGHHLLLTAIIKSFEMVPITRSAISLSALGNVGVIMTELSVIAIKISAPVMVAILFVNIAMGVAGRAVPQINVLVTSMPVNTLLGFMALIISLPLFFTEVNQILSETTLRLFQIIKAF